MARLDGSTPRRGVGSRHGCLSVRETQSMSKACPHKHNWNKYATAATPSMIRLSPSCVVLRFWESLNHTSQQVLKNVSELHGDGAVVRAQGVA
eukprot:2301323-Amphidinium_carterae.1